MKRTLIAAAIVAVLIPGGVFGQRVPPPTPYKSDGMFHEVFEMDRGKFHPMTPSTTAVDANADLVVSFGLLTNLAAAKPSADWVQVSNALQLMEARASQQKALLSRLPAIKLDDTNAVASFNKEVVAFNLATAKAIPAQRQQLALGTKEFDAILAGEFDGRANPAEPYANLTRWLTNRLAQLHRAAASFVEAHTVQVTVQAFHRPRSGAEKPVHVDNYDYIPAGEYRPVDRYGLKMTEEEQKRLVMELKMTEAAATAIRVAQTNRTQLRAFLQDKLDEVRRRLDPLRALMDSDAAEWKGDFRNTKAGQALTQLGSRNDAPEEVRDAARALLDELGQFNQEFQQVGSLYRKIVRVVDLARDGSGATLVDMVAATSEVANRLSDLDAASVQLARQVAGWPARLKTALGHLKTIGAHVDADIRDKLLPEAVQKFIGEFGTSFPDLANALRTMSDLLGGVANDKGVAAGVDAVANAPVEMVWRDASDALPALVELARVGLVPGDSMMLKVTYRERGTNGVPGRVISVDDYRVETVLMGIHRKIDASLIFARGLKGGRAEEQWKPNVAALVNWHYRIREDETRRARAWNFVNPGLGLHLASLDQGTDSVEFGTGVNLSLFDGLLTGGYGINLNNHEHPYVFFGIGLLEVLDKAKQLKNR